MSLKKFSLQSSNRIVFMKKLIAVLVLLGFAWLIVSAITNSVDSEELEPKVIKAPEMVKYRPVSPGGMKIENQDKQVFDLLETETSVKDNPTFVVAKSKAAEKRDEELKQQALEKKQQKEEVKKEHNAKKVEVSKKVVSKENEKEPSIKSAQKEKAVKIFSKDITGWVVQLGSFRKESDAERAVGIYNKKVGNILQGLSPYVKKASLGEKGIVYRVYFTGLKDKGHAKQICDQLKAQKQDCLRTKL